MLIGLTVLSLVGVWLNVKKRKECFYIWSVTNAVWAVVDFRAGLWEQGSLFAVYFIMAVWGVIEWTKKKQI